MLGSDELEEGGRAGSASLGSVEDEPSAGARGAARRRRRARSVDGEGGGAGAAAAKRAGAAAAELDHRRHKPLAVEPLGQVEQLRPRMRRLDLRPFADKRLQRPGDAGERVSPRAIATRVRRRGLPSRGIGSSPDCRKL